jgi:hypothetical protein
MVDNKIQQVTDCVAVKKNLDKEKIELKCELALVNEDSALF